MYIRVLEKLTDTALSAHLISIYRDYLPTQGTSLPKVVYIDCKNSFPIRTFHAHLATAPSALSVTSEQIMENVRVVVCLDLTELRKAIQTLSHSLAVERASSKETDPSSTSTTFVILCGLDAMYRATHLVDHLLAHQQLNDSLLRLRILAAEQESGALQTDILLPRAEFPRAASTLLYKEASNSTHPIKKPRSSWYGSGNMLGDYIIKFYTD
ncbi:AER368Cp [Eremothecium gossypii ATCC 10895]|uniref:Chromosome segregation in meiosis protein 2 n=1 Tax=Eremothecium gossypii (strain ATCC 10895 / CBS 109.51 / FGSC 9923 / NRRL Y-1056) TaxID=284811 RepID=CSM2_EREGS|nr:AER368Cp [Eremothecium gossypii ATCC 10895]Q755Z9.1 RecName: Full=Chromosome segregation in meiosis protein 2 [Eremothecium gossypii ATCC 10895]AAS53048.1 AER368Cp [Eremothecium gossypii ATCC 10895]AEY97356.1 FAER368Cp [Eremothecium gossypii FDAG1]